MIFTKISMCLTNFCLIKQLTKKLSTHVQNWFAIDTNCIIYRKASTKLLPVQKYNTAGRFPSESENETQKLPADVSQFLFSESWPRVEREWNSLASLGCARTGCIRCKMACHFAKLALSSPPRF